MALVLKKVNSGKRFQSGHEANVANLTSYISRQLIKFAGNGYHVG